MRFVFRVALTSPKSGAFVGETRADSLLENRRRALFGASALKRGAFDAKTKINERRFDQRRVETIELYGSSAI